MFPLRDENPRVHFPYATVAIIILNALVWVAVQGLGSEYKLAESLCLYGLVPGDLLGNLTPGTNIQLSANLSCQFDGSANPASLVTSMFMHGGWFHIIGNMWFLWVFGDNVEDVMGPVRFIAFYVICGLAAAFAQIVTDTSSAIPMVGASGAIGGVMGAYALLFPRAHVHTLIFLGFYITTVAIPAIFMLGYWFALQLLQGLPALGSTQGGVAFWAHIGGFVAGVALIHLFRRRDYLSSHRSQQRRSTSRHRWL
ncbi:MAG: rhomboid family intramembrane serine protease [Gammaproteobacteria bacterium]|nr:rhomboid family intramembrane serine protease [Gammaproteobacteria bacterium]